jgi:DNA (cytosine-5)-methyltransferase 1
VNFLPPPPEKLNAPGKTLGEICAGIGGFSLGFEQAGWRSAWQIELDDVNRAVLADRFPDAKHYRDLRDWARFGLSPVHCIAAGFPCQDVSILGASRKDKSRTGLAGSRSGLFFEIMEIVGSLQPLWVVLENVPGLLFSNDHRDFQTVINELAKRNYVGHARVLDAQYFGIPQKRRRIFLVTGLGRQPSLDFLADAAAVESLPCSPGASWLAKPGDTWAGFTLAAPNKFKSQNSRINISSELFIAEENGWDQMVDRQRTSEIHGVPCGLDKANAEEAYAAGNAVPPPMAKWIAEILNKS